MEYFYISILSQFFHWVITDIFLTLLVYAMTSIPKNRWTFVFYESYCVWGERAGDSLSLANFLESHQKVEQLILKRSDLLLELNKWSFRYLKKKSIMFSSIIFFKYQCTRSRLSHCNIWNYLLIFFSWFFLN